VEVSFGLAKELHWRETDPFKGRRKAQIQLWLTAAAMNIKKAVRGWQRALGQLELLASPPGFMSCCGFGAHTQTQTCQFFGNKPVTS
jgi:hypothetical protein